MLDILLFFRLILTHCVYVAGDRIIEIHFKLLIFIGRCNVLQAGAKLPIPLPPILNGVQHIPRAHA